MADATATSGTPSPGSRNDAISRLLASRRVVLGGGVLLLFALAAALRAALRTARPGSSRTSCCNTSRPFWDENAKPGYLFGTDNLGRGHPCPG